MAFQNGLSIGQDEEREMVANGFSINTVDSQTSLCGQLAVGVVAKASHSIIRPRRRNVTRRRQQQQTNRPKNLNSSEEILE